VVWQTAVTVLAEEVKQKATFEETLRCQEAFGFVADAPVTVVIDGLSSFAFEQLERVRNSRAILVTQNPCVEYWCDARASGALGLLVGAFDADDLGRALSAVQAGFAFSNQPKDSSPLTPRERMVLHGVANGLEDKRIALNLGIESAVVRNYVSNVMAKLRAAKPELHLESRVHLALYYWGVWSALNIRSRGRTFPTTASRSAA
jgi:DNA-binding NarL/FixJ family response regulator